MSKYLIIFFFLFVSLVSSAQECCLETNVVTLCYTAEEDFCTFNSCNYTYDATFMRGINMKIANKDNFGPQGTSCEIVTKPIGNISTIEEIEALECRIVFIGHFAEDNNAGYGTTISNSFLTTVREWSKKCEENLVILFQDEAELWGYSIEDNNVNPNIQGSSITKNIFDGPFGRIPSFRQGGSFQANFTGLAPNGADILAVDGNNRPTVVLDKATNDLILADVGIFCNQVGNVTVSSIISSNNDILACNLIAVGCDIATNDFTEEKIQLCQGGSYVLPDGTQVTDEGEYTTVLKNSNNCDSTVTTEIQIVPIDTSEYNYIGCVPDGFSIEIGSSTYDLNNLTGIEKLKTENGCDSLVVIELVFNETSASSFDSTFCSRQPFDFNGILISSSIDTVITINNAQGCDSIISVTVDEIFFDASVIETAITVRNGIPYQMNNIVPIDFDILWEDAHGLSCYDCPNPVVVLDENIEAYNLSLTSPEGCMESYTIIVEYICEPYIPNIMNVGSVNGDELFGPMGSCAIEDYSFKIYDRWGGIAFESDEQAEKWNGTDAGREYETGVYVYKLDYTMDNMPKSITGMVHLIR